MKDLYYYGRMAQRYDSPEKIQGRIPLPIINELYSLRDNDDDAYELRLDDAEDYEILYGIMEDFPTREQFNDAMKTYGSITLEEIWFGIGTCEVTAKLGFVDCE